MKHFQRGVDGARLDLISLDQGEDDGYRSPVVYYTCKEGKKTKIGKTGKKIYDEPDQIGNVAEINAGFSSNKVRGIEIHIIDVDDGDDDGDDDDVYTLTMPKDNGTTTTTVERNTALFDPITSNVISSGGRHENPFRC